MDNEVTNDYIDKALNELYLIFGVKESIDYKKLILLIDAKKIKEAVNEIALYLALPISVNISYVPKGYRPNSNDGFSSLHLVKTDTRNRGIGGITAQVSIPQNLPLYRSPGMVNFPISVRLSENCAENPATLISVMAHELSHIVLYSMWHKEKQNEFYTDITAMLLGFAKNMEIGRKVIKTKIYTSSGFLSSTTTTHTETTTYGYLSDENFDFAFHKIKDLLNKQKTIKIKLLKKFELSRKQLCRTKRLLFCFEKYLEYLDKNLKQEIFPEDIKKLSAFHQPGYTDSSHFFLREETARLEVSLKNIEDMQAYTEGSVKMMREYDVQLDLTNKELIKYTSLLKNDMDVLRKYIGFLYKIKLKFLVLFQKCDPHKYRY